MEPGVRGRRPFLSARGAGYSALGAPKVPKGHPRWIPSGPLTPGSVLQARLRLAAGRGRLRKAAPDLQWGLARRGEARGPAGPWKNAVLGGPARTRPPLFPEGHQNGRRRGRVGARQRRGGHDPVGHGDPPGRRGGLDADGAVGGVAAVDESGRQRPCLFRSFRAEREATFRRRDSSGRNAARLPARGEIAATPRDDLPAHQPSGFHSSHHARIAWSLAVDGRFRPFRQCWTAWGETPR